MMITDRTQQQVDEAIAIRDKVKDGQDITESEILTFERGFITANTLNRVETKQAEIARILNDNGYPVRITTKQWQYDDAFTIADYNRIIINLETLRQAFYTFKNTPDTPLYLYGYREMNDFEKILVDVEKAIGNMKSIFIYSSSDIYSGGVY
jgi:hypothetical protein